MSENSHELLEKVNYACTLNSTTLTAVLSILINKGLITAEEMQEAFEEAKSKIQAVK
ncbi:MAG: hypothetical protein PHQ23_00065 [Candidatus Wallbacteria bacterium]|nr:hypothetical protein [Candidatus Wallbacteria bacterium]